MPSAPGHNLLLDKLRALLNPDATSDSVEYLYGYNKEGDRRWYNLVCYLQFMKKGKPDTLLIGEAPGYRGTSVSGVPFLSENVINTRKSTGKTLPFTDYLFSSEYDLQSGFEATSTFMWDVLDDAELPRLPLLWAVFPNHPHCAGDLMSNRKPTKKEIALYEEVTPLLIEAYSIQNVVAVGNVAYDTLSLNTYQNIVKLRHPARGGSKKFRDEFNAFAERTYGYQR